MYYMAYGSNLNKSQMNYRCPGATPVGVYSLEGYKLEFRRRPHISYLTITEKEGSKVPVVVWNVTAEHMAYLDRYEGYPEHYRREVFEIEVDGAIEKAFVYIMNGGELAEPTKFYYSTCVHGYDDFHIDKTPLWNAYKEVEGK